MKQETSNSQTTLYDHKEVCRKAAMELPREQRQKFLNGIWHGMTIKEAYEEVGISFEAALGVLNMNLVRETTLILNLEAI